MVKTSISERSPLSPKDWPADAFVWWRSLVVAAAGLSRRFRAGDRDRARALRQRRRQPARPRSALVAGHHRPARLVRGRVRRLGRGPSAPRAPFARELGAARAERRRSGLGRRRRRRDDRGRRAGERRARRGVPPQIRRGSGALAARCARLAGRRIRLLGLRRGAVLRRVRLPRLSLQRAAALSPGLGRRRVLRDRLRPGALAAGQRRRARSIGRRRHRARRSSTISAAR